MSLEARGGGRRRLSAVTLDEASIGRGTPDQEHERRIAICDLIEDNAFAVQSHEGGPYRLAIALQDSKLLLAVSTEDDRPVISHLLALKPLRGIIRDYLMLCDSYQAAVRASTPGRIEAIDMGRRGLHDEGARALGARLAGKIDCDGATWRRLFTLVTALHWKG